MLKGRGRDPRGVGSPAPAHFNMRPPALTQPRTPLPQRQPLKPEPDYEVVEFPSDQYVNAKLQPPPPPPPRPPTGHPAQAGGPCGLCGGGGARVRCAECGRRALCASCDDMYHRHPKRRHHQRQALSPSQLSDVRPPLPPKQTTAPVPPPRRHKMSASPKPPMTMQDQRHATLGHAPLTGVHAQPSPTFNQHQPLPVHIQNKLAAPQPHPGHIGSMPFLNTMPQPGPVQHPTLQSNTLGHFNSSWNRPRGSLQGFNMPQMTSGAEAWDGSEGVSSGQGGWGRPLRRGASVLELGGTGACPGCAHCAPTHAPTPWRYGSCASLDHPWAGAWPTPAAAPPCCQPHPHHTHPHAHLHPSQTPQPYRRADSRTLSRAASRAGSRAASPALSVRSRASRRNKHRTPSPPPLPSSDADSESESEDEPAVNRRGSRQTRAASREPANSATHSQPTQQLPTVSTEDTEDTLGPAPAPPAGPWYCEHCTFLNEAGVRVCAVCCRTPTAAPRVVNDLARHVDNLHIANDDSSQRARARDSPRIEVRDAEEPKRSESSKSNRERASTGCGPSPPREPKKAEKAASRLVTPNREHNGGTERPQSRHDMAAGPSPPRDAHRYVSEPATFREANTVRVSPYRETKELPKTVSPQRHSVSVGPSPPRESHRHNVSVGPSPPRESQRHNVSVGPSPPRESLPSVNFQKKSAGTSPPRDVPAESRPTSARITKTNVSNTGTSPPPQSISTQTYEDPTTWEREGAGSSAGVERARARRRLRDDARRERSRSRHSLSSDTRESERSVRTTAGGGWEWRERERDVSPPAAEWGRLARRASHLDLRRARTHRRSSFYGSQAVSPEPVNNRAMSVEALAGARSPRTPRTAAVQLARLLADAERLGYDAAEVQVALDASPEAPLEWLRSRWGGLAGAVCGAAARLAPHTPLSEREARAALARHRGAVWPAVTECVDALRGQADAGRVSSAARVRGRVWGSPAGADDDAAAPRARAEYSSDECDPPPPEDEWGLGGYEAETRRDSWGSPPPLPYGAEEVARTLRSLLARAGLPSIDESLLMRGLVSDPTRPSKRAPEPERNARVTGGPPSFDLIQSENDFIDAYNALTRASPLPNISGPLHGSRIVPECVLTNFRTEHDYSLRDDELRSETRERENAFKRTSPPVNISELSSGDRVVSATVLSNDKTEHDYSLTAVDVKDDEMRSDINENVNINKTQMIEETQQATISGMKENNVETAPLINNTQTKLVPKTAKITILQSEDQSVASTVTVIPTATAAKPATITINEGYEIKSPTQDLQQNKQAEKKTGNLNDIVDNTQKLIQQMKDEINSDINSLEDGHAQTSQSEHDTSSNDEREESSYSESEEDTDNITSDEREMSSEGEYVAETVQKHSLNGETFPNRTSSEDNEQFEEALDNLDNQIEDVKHVNIEILNSIARSLQEEHTLSIEFNDTKEQILAKEGFEPKTNEPISETIKNKNEVNQLKHYINMNENQDSNNNLFVPVNTFDEIYAELNTSINSIREKNHTGPSQSVKANAVIISPPVESKILTTKHAIYELTFEGVAPTKLMLSEKKDPIFNAIIETIEVDKEIVENNEKNAESETVQEEAADQEKVTNGRSSSLESSSSSKSEMSYDDTQNTTNSIDIKADVVLAENDDQEVIPVDVIGTNNDNLLTESLTEHDMSISVEKVSDISTNDKNTNKTMPVRSNIPKLIKSSIKAKVDKLAPKLLVSKVPVRRTSIKQYPAPAPPKTHFGNVQSGHVKQLQSKIFNGAKPVKPQTPVTIDVTPSTSTATLTKKKPAPAPPGKQPEQKQPSPVKASPPKEKRNNYFRETCRTEDEWTDSDSEDSQSQVVKPSENRDEPFSPPSPPPPLTLRRVSGQIIDLANVQLPEGSPERQARMLLAAGAMETWEQARLAVELVGRGAAPPAALLAALECADLPSALAYLHQDCELCASRLPEHEMVSMLRCTHRCCRECARLYFTVQITERSIADCVCPYCKLPELETLPEDAWLEYFAHLDILLKTLLEIDVHELFQRKLRDRTLARDPNFRWCMECSSGFFVHPKQKKLRCPECRSVSCASCRKPWSSNHEGLSCEQYTAWVEDNDPERSVAAVQQHLRENGLECPRCHFKYSLSRGGCMHFTCTQCKFEFCYGCGKPFTMGARCGLSEYCAKLGLHAHHPRNCLFYLRDKEPHELQTLLQMNNVAYETQAGEGGKEGRCPIQLQRETPAGLVDGVCGSEAPPNYAGLCKNHYLEYLCRVVRARGVDPLPLLGVDDLETLVRRAALRPPPRPYGSLDGLYKRALIEIVREKIPLD